MQKIACRNGLRPLALRARLASAMLGTLSLTSVVVLTSAFTFGCNKHSDPPPNAPAFPASVTPAPGPGDGTARAAPTLAASPTLAPPATGAPLSQPNPLALACTLDAHCLTHRCNVAAGKCAWPCQTDNDCMPGNACIAPTCLPKLQ